MSVTVIARLLISTWVTIGAPMRPVRNLPKPSATFHGRDIFAPVAAELAAAGEIEVTQRGLVVEGLSARGAVRLRRTC